MPNFTRPTEDKTSRSKTRRRVLTTAAGILTAGMAVPSEQVAAQSGSEYEGWFENVENFDGATLDRRGQDTVTIRVGAEGNGGNFAFAPPAIRVDPGTTVVFKWASDTHNVLPEAVPEEASWSGHQTLEDKGFTYEHDFEVEGLYKYYCDPHRPVGMKGAIVVGDQGAGETAAKGGATLLRPGLPALFFGGLGLVVVSFLVGVFYGGRLDGNEPRTAALVGLGAAVIGGLFVLTIVARLVIGA